MIAPEINELLAILMDTPGLKQQEIGPLLRRIAERKNQRSLKFNEVIFDMIEAWEC